MMRADVCDQCILLHSLNSLSRTLLQAYVQERPGAGFYNRE
jgi:hypothetical protein